MKKILYSLILISIIFIISGCSNDAKVESNTIITTTYPITYLVNELDDNNMTVTSLYPNGVDVTTYELTDKQLDNYSKSAYFIYNGLVVKEKELAINLLNRNANLKLIDVSQGLTIDHDTEELWLSPSNYLMFAQNIEKGLLNYTTSTPIKDEIEENYEDLKLTISTYDANFKKIAENAKDKDLIVSNDVFKFLSKYGFNIISVENNSEFLNSDLTKAKNLIKNKNNTYVFVLDTDADSDNVNTLLSLGAQKISIKSMTNLSLDDVKNNIDYKTMMNDFLDNIRNEVYE